MYWVFTEDFSGRKAFCFERKKRKKEGNCVQPLTVRVRKLRACSVNLLQLEKQCVGHWKKSRPWEFPGGLVVGTQCFDCCGPGSIPGRVPFGTVQPKKKEWALSRVSLGQSLASLSLSFLFCKFGMLIPTWFWWSPGLGNNLMVVKVFYKL